jgi:hypothetical protein
MTETQRKSERTQQTLRRAVVDELEKTRQVGQYVVICQNGEPVRLQPEQMPEQGGG